ncbi:MAG: glycoside hydrolase family 13 protein [Actinomycetota bacterium]
MANWWDTAVVYQVYLRSFADGNGDGQGDIAGLRSRLHHVADLGVDAIWLNPWYASPLEDGGYDVADYRAIEPSYGSLEDAEGLIEDCHTLGIRVIADLVPNHTSDQHVWFQEALASEPGSTARDRYIFRPGRGDGSEPPNNWIAMFGGSAWQRVPDGEWYLHLFDTTQPDLNWDNDEVRAEFDDIMRFWLDRGIDGFRIDVAHGMVKHPDLPDADPLPLPWSMQHVDPAVAHPYWDRDGIHEINRRWRAILDGYEDRMMVAEAWVHAERLPLYLRADEYHQSFNFDLLETPWSAETFRSVIGAALDEATAIEAGSTWVLSNHDVMRHATRYGLPNDVDWRRWPMAGPHDLLDQSLGDRRARAAALITMSLPGSTYIYQGEELGLPDVWDLPLDVLDDPTWVRSGNTEKGRDGCRVPLPWATDAQAYGFGANEPWLPQPEIYGERAADAQHTDPDSMLNLYRRTIAARKHLLAEDPPLRFLDFGPGLLAYERGVVQVVANMGSRAVPMPPGRVALTSATEHLGDELPADTAVWLI